MKLIDDDVREALRRDARRRSGDRGECPSLDALARAAAGAPDGAAEGILDHLAHCPECALEYRLASSMRPWAEGAAAALTQAPPVRVGSPAPRLLPLTLAASLCVGLLGWVLALRQDGRRLETRLADAEQVRRQGDGESARLRETQASEAASLRREAEALTQPQPNVPLLDLFPRDGARGSGGAAPVLDPSGSPFVVLIVNLREPEADALYAVELQDASGHRVWTAEDLHAGPEPLTLGLPSRRLSSDAYRIQVYRVRGDRRTLAGEYAFRVRHGGGGARP